MIQKITKGKIETIKLLVCANISYIFIQKNSKRYVKSIFKKFSWWKKQTNIKVQDKKSPLLVKRTTVKQRK